MRAVASFRLFGVTDLTWELVPLAYWSYVSPRLHPFLIHNYPHIYVYLHIFLGLPLPRDAEIASGLVCVSVPVLPQLLRRLAPLIKSKLGSYHRSNSGSNGSKTFKVSWGGARYQERAADAELGKLDPYDDLHTPNGVYLETDGQSDGAKSEETFAAKRESPGLSFARDDFTEGGTLVRDVEGGLRK